MYAGHFQDKFSPADKEFLSEAGNKKFDSLIKSTVDGVQGFRAIYFANACMPLKAELVVLIKDSGGGREGGVSWKQNIAERATSWPKFMRDTEGSIRKVDKLVLISKYQSVEQVLLLIIEDVHPIDSSCGSITLPLLISPIGFWQIREALQAVQSCSGLVYRN